MAFSSGSGGGPMADINVTPLVDVMLVLLIIFMITAPLMTHKVVVKLPEATLTTKPIIKVPPVMPGAAAPGRRLSACREARPRGRRWRRSRAGRARRCRTWRRCRG